MRVFDASIVVKILTEETLSIEASALMALEADRIAPAILPFEVASALSKKARYAGLSRALVDRAMSGLSTLSIDLVALDTLVDLAMTLSIELQHSFYENLYLALAEKRNCSLVTADRKFALRVGGSRYAYRLELLEPVEHDK